jgi:hypothetical protein
VAFTSVFSVSADFSCFSARASYEPSASESASSLSSDFSFFSFFALPFLLTSVNFLALLGLNVIPVVAERAS